MSQPLVFNFTFDVSIISIPSELNDPFGFEIPEIAQIASSEFQAFIKSEEPNWEYDFTSQRGKMFGVLVVEKTDKSLGYLGTMSGVFPGGKTCPQFVPSVFDPSTDDYFINKGMTELTEIGELIKNSTKQAEIGELTESRKQKSHDLQQWLFEKYVFTNRKGIEKNVLNIFADSLHGNPPAAAGECAAPKLLQYAFSNGLKPIAIAEFWWGNPSKNKEREPFGFYPACTDKCKPILGYMFSES